MSSDRTGPAIEETPDRSIRPPELAVMYWYV